MTLEEMNRVAKSKGYAPTVSRGDCIEIQRVDEENVFPSDEEAVAAAIRDGIPIIPVDELPKNFGDGQTSFRWLGWVDTPENRAAIEAFCSGK